MRKFVMMTLGAETVRASVLDTSPSRFAGRVEARVRIDSGAYADALMTVDVWPASVEREW